MKSLPQVLARHQLPLLLIGGLTVVTVAGVLLGSDNIQVAMTEMMIRIVTVVGLYIFISNSGIISFGHIGFMCIGAYAAGWATAEPTFKRIMLTGLPDSLQQGQYPFLVAIGGAILLPAVVALVFGAAIMRLTGAAAAIATFAFLMIVNSIYSNWDSVTAGVSSIIGIPTTVGPWIGFAFAALAIVVAYLFQISRFGLMLRASRDDEVAAKASGVSTESIRLVAFVLSAAVVGASGGLYAHFLGILSVDSFYLNMSFLTLAMLVVGGMSSLTGALAGVLVVTAVIEVLRFLERGVSLADTSFALPQGSQELGLGLLMALIMVFRPKGVTGGREIWMSVSGQTIPAEPAHLSARAVQRD
jgi:branched-chain amino acid transport system permease protein